MHPGEILWPLDGFVEENLSDFCKKSIPQLQNKAQFRSLNIKVQNVDYIVFSGEYNL